jgi:Rel homology DNA-binding domain
VGIADKLKLCAHNCDRFETLGCQCFISGTKGFSLIPEEELLSIRRRAEEQAKSMQLNVVRLRFRAYLLNESGACTSVLPDVISNAIHDSSKYF